MSGKRQDATSAGQTPAPAKPPKPGPVGVKDKIKKRQKAFQTRSKNGCLTCRRRKIRCDETRPQCHRCTKAGRECDYKRFVFRDPAIQWSHGDSSSSAPLLAAPDTNRAIEPLTPDLQNLAQAPYNHFTYPTFDSDQRNMYLHQHRLPLTSHPAEPILGSNNPAQPHIPMLKSQRSTEIASAERPSFMNTSYVEAPVTNLDHFMHLSSSLEQFAPLESSAVLMSTHNDALEPAPLDVHLPLVQPHPQSKLHVDATFLQDGHIAKLDETLHTGGFFYEQDEPKRVLSATLSETLTNHTSSVNSSAITPTDDVSRFTRGPQALRRLDISEALDAAAVEMENDDFFDVDEDEDRSSGGSLHSAHAGQIDTFRPEYIANPLRNKFTAKVFFHFIYETAPCLSVFEKAFMGDVQPWEIRDGHSVGGLWSRTLPAIAMNNQGLLHAILALGSLQLANTHLGSDTPARKHYVWSVKRTNLDVTLGRGSRNSLAMLGATLLLSFFEVLAGDHIQFNTHMRGANILVEEACASGVLDSNASTANNFDSLAYYDLFWWYNKQDTILALMTCNELLMEQSKRGYWIPRAIVGDVNAVHGSFDHLCCILADIATFAAKDAVRKADSARATAEAHNIAYQPPPFCGLIPPAQLPTPKAYRPVQNEALLTAHNGQWRDELSVLSPPSFLLSPQDGQQTEDESFSQASMIWTNLRSRLLAFDEHLGPGFHPVPADGSQGYTGLDTFASLQPIFYATASIANLRMYLHMAYITLQRVHPRMPPFAYAAVPVAASQTIGDAEAICRIASGLHFPAWGYGQAYVEGNDRGQRASPHEGLKAAYTDSQIPLFVAAVQYRDPPLRQWCITRLRSIAHMSGWGVAAKLAGSLEAT